MTIAITLPLCYNTRARQGYIALAATKPQGRNPTMTKERKQQAAACKALLANEWEEVYYEDHGFVGFVHSSNYAFTPMPPNGQWALIDLVSGRQWHGDYVLLALRALRLAGKRAGTEGIKTATAKLIELRLSFC